MGFGKRAPKKEYKKNDSKNSGNTEKSVENHTKKNGSISSRVDNNNNSNNIVSGCMKIKKQKKTLNFLKKTKRNSSNVLLFGVTKEEKLQQFVINIKLLHPSMPDFWQQNEISKFKKKFNIQDNK